MKIIRLNNTVKVLQKYGKLLLDRYRNELSTKDINASGNLSQKTRYDISAGDMEWTMELELPYYWKYVEEGIAPAGKYGNPKRKAYPFILKWTEVKGIDPKAGETREQLAWRITMKIYKYGIKGKFPLKNSLSDVLDKAFDDELSKAISEDLRLAFDFIDVEVVRG